MPRTQADAKRDKITFFMNALESYVRAEIQDNKPSDDVDSLGTYHERQALREAVEDLVGSDG